MRILIMDSNYNEDITTVLESNSFVTSYYFDLDTGYGNMIYYHLFDGIDIVYNDFNADNCNQLDNIGNYDDYIIINHCNKGRFETIFNDNYLYLTEGDLVFSIGSNKYMHDFPLGYYKGFQISIDLKVAQKSIDNVIGKNIIKLDDLISIINDNGSFVIIRSNKQIDHIISELYSVDDNIREGYYKLKVMELLLFLKNFTIKNVKEEYPTLKEDNVKIIKRIKAYLVDNIDKNITLDDLSVEFNVSKTSIKNYFKTIYGKSLNSWRREFRLNKAANYLESTSMNIGDISELVGYKNHGKFTDAFKRYYSMTPSEYRNSHKN